MLKVLYLLISITYISEAAFQCPAEDSDRIVGGSYAAISQFPYQVSIQVTFKMDIYDPICSGGIVARKWILTAAQCLKYKSKQYKIVAGVIGLEQNNDAPQIRKAKRFFIHPRYNYTNDNHLSLFDAALIEIDQLQFNDAVQPLRLPKDKSEPSGNAILAGWGSVDSIGAIFVKRLKYIDVFIPERAECNYYYPNFSTQSHFCVCAKNHRDFCRGDGGSPLVQNGTVVGIVCGNDFICASSAPSIYTKVSSIVPFIKSHIGKDTVF